MSKTLTYEAAKLLCLPFHWPDVEHVYQFYHTTDGLRLRYHHKRKSGWHDIRVPSKERWDFIVEVYGGLPVLWERPINPD